MRSTGIIIDITHRSATIVHASLEHTAVAISQELQSEREISQTLTRQSIKHKLYQKETESAGLFYNMRSFSYFATSADSPVVL